MDVVDTLKKEIRDMNVMELIEKIGETTKIAALWRTDRERTNITIYECAQKIKISDYLRIRKNSKTPSIILE